MKDHPQIINKKQPSVPKKRFVYMIKHTIRYIYYISTLAQKFMSVDVFSISTSTDSTVTTQESPEILEEETPNKVKKVEVEIQSDKDDSSTGTNSDVGKIFNHY